ncbi:MAG: histidine kinase [Archangiaceae bacterium]|nr:histidine kinase [Archangiaceae bacterium]
MERLKPTPSSIVRATWWALLTPRRVVPILGVGVPLCYAQAYYSQDAGATALGVLMVLTFVALAPVSYRVLFPDGLDLSHGAVRLVIYATVGAGVVLSVLVALPRLLGMGPTFLGERTSLAVSVGLFLVGGWGLGRDIAYEHRVEKLTRAAEEAQLLALRAHFDPHFLFNTLNAIAEWCRTDGEVAEAAVLKLSAMLRTLLDGVKENRWPLERELQLVRDLFELHLLRDRGLFELEEAIIRPLPEVSVPPMSLLTLAENAVKHGPAAGHRGTLHLSIVKRDGGALVAIENPGRFNGPRAGSDGLPTLERRLKLAYEGRAKLSVGPASEVARTRAEIWFPGEAAR